jgi:hypothetical protein
MNKKLLVFQWIALLITAVLLFVGCDNPDNPESETEPGPLTVTGQLYTEAGDLYTGATKVYAFYADPPTVANNFAEGTVDASGNFSITLPFPIPDTSLKDTFISGITLSPVGTKTMFPILKIGASAEAGTGGRQLNRRKSSDDRASLVYSNKGATASGSATFNLKEGWNTIFGSSDNITVGDPGADYKWVLNN